jgi:hypothetical protein
LLLFGPPLHRLEQWRRSTAGTEIRADAGWDCWEKLAAKGVAPGGIRLLAVANGLEAVNQCQAALAFGVPVGLFGDVAPRLHLDLEKMDWWPHPDLQILSAEISDIQRFLSCNVEL